MPTWIANHSFTNSHTVSRILSMIVAGPYYFSLSRTLRWVDVPPVPLATDTLVPREILVYKRAYEVLAAFRNPCGPRELPTGPRGESERWSLVPPEVVLLQKDGTYTPDITHLYISLLVEEADHAAPYSNVVGLHSGIQLTLDANVGEQAVTYPPSMVNSSGTLHWLAYTSPIERVLRLSHEISFLLTP
jgi:hypothetical protein